MFMNVHVLITSMKGNKEQCSFILFFLHFSSFTFRVSDICPKMMRVTGKSVTGTKLGLRGPGNPELGSWWTIFTVASHHHKHGLCKYKLISGDWDIHHHEKWDVRPTYHYQIYHGPFRSPRKMFYFSSSEQNRFSRLFSCTSSRLQ